jgi:hypothetical protein
MNVANVRDRRAQIETVVRRSWRSLPGGISQCWAVGIGAHALLNADLLRKNARRIDDTVVLLLTGFLEYTHGKSEVI